MITDPLTSDDHLEIGAIVGDFTQRVFSSDRVREAAAGAPGFDELAWKQMVELGWSGLGVPAVAGGAELGVFVQCIVHRELGARLAPSPYLATAAFAATALDELADPELSGGLLAAIAGEPTLLALVLGHGRGWSSAPSPLVTATRSGAGWVLDGAVPLVPDAARAQRLIVVAAIDERNWGLFRVDAKGVSHPVRTVDSTRAFGDLLLRETPAVALHRETFDRARIDGLVDRLAVFLAAEMVGAAIACLNQTLDYLRTRRQFGRPIGSFQALKHRCADLAVGLTTAQELVFAAAETADTGDAAALALFAPLALARAGEVLKRTSEEGIQLHGGVGFTDEFDIGRYYKRALADLEILSGPATAYARMDAVRRGWPA
ncbi:acyl-CoA dehydrogenase family protein [Acrocarpospora macrocephala]|uniref:Acyl-CoA dehydrogenase n=1 Tax=Acrocarpospora macrocephala TaxID=150177 RepID=A0A5M3WFZ9_9ACTN|nr:acyl-CoA dehydrogenase family protein [Acrocarpospora macrocephala]GES07200.1 acyl-CoA dehydrogenase [Acrocarpospora macrocephala]